MIVLQTIKTPCQGRRPDFQGGGGAQPPIFGRFTSKNEWISRPGGKGLEPMAHAILNN